MTVKLEIEYTKYFLRLYKKLHPALKIETKEAIEKFQNLDNHLKLKVHKLSGKGEGKYSFSVNYSHRIIFEYINEHTIAVLMAVGDHDLYEDFLRNF